MKLRDLERHLLDGGSTKVGEGASHTKWRGPGGSASAVPRHQEIDYRLVRSDRSHGIVRALVVAAVSALALTSAGCRDSFRGAESDEELRAAFNKGLAQQVRGRPFAMRDALPGGWTALWFFGGYTPADAIEGAVGAPWPGAPSEVPEGDTAVVVRGPGDQVRGFMWGGGKVFSDCLPMANRPVTPDARLILLGPMAGEDQDWSLLLADTPRARRQCPSLAVVAKAGR